MSKRYVKADWEYFLLEPIRDNAEKNGYHLVSEDYGDKLTLDGSYLVFPTREDAEEYLEENDIRGSIR